MRRLVGFALAVLLLVPLTAFSATPDEGRAEFPPLPSPDERQARDRQESEAGAVVLERVIDLWGEGDPKWVTMGGSTRRTERVRYLVLDPRGAERLASYAFVDLGRAEDTEVHGRTILESGQVIPLDTRTDVRDLDRRDSRGRTTTTIRTVRFPRIEPGAILDLQWTSAVDQLPQVEFVQLGEEFPVRRLEVRSTGTLFETTATRQALRGIFTGASVTGNLYWVPFFLGTVPEHAHASLDPSFDLHLVVRDLPGVQSEPWSPPDVRCRAMLALIPRLLTYSKKTADDDWRQNVVLFGPPEDLPASGRHIIEQDIDPARALVRLDDLGLQEIPAVGPASRRLRFHQNGLRAFHDDLVKFLATTGAAEGPAEVARIAPEDGSRAERARVLFEHVRRRLTVDPRADLQKNLKKLLSEGTGRGWNLSAYYLYLLRTAGIPAHSVFAFSRQDLPFHPIIESWQVYDVAQLVEIETETGEALYVGAPARLNNFETIPEQYLGALAFREPERTDEDWIGFRIPLDLDTHEEYAVAAESPVPAAPGDEVPLTFTGTFGGTASYYVRGAFSSPADRESSEEARARGAARADALLERWLGTHLTGELPLVDPPAEPGAPFIVELDSAWQPEVLEVDGEWLLPALPPSEAFRNDFRDERRQLPLWLYGGQQQLDFTWTVPAEWDVAEVPPPRREDGPGGLRFELTVDVSETADGTRASSRLSLRSPYVLPAADYPEATAFFAALQEAARTRLTLRRRDRS